MDVAEAMPPAGYQPGSPRERAVSAMLSAAIILLALLLALRQTGMVPQLGGGKALTTFDVPAEKAAAKASPQHAVTHPTAPTMPRPKIDIARPDAPKEQVAPGFIHMTHEDFVAGDIARTRAPALAQGDANADSGDQGANDGRGGGPGGVRLYNADWYRPPTDAQLATYLPRFNPGPGWGEIACRTIDHFHVDDCQILGESPSGSGYGRAVLDAAWQFQVIPPRVNSKMQVGAWVRIRIDYTQNGARAG